MNKYDVPLDLSTNNSLSIMLKKIKERSIILEFGPAMGRMTKYLSETLNCDVYIVEIDNEAFVSASQYSKDGMCDNIENFAWKDKFSYLQFDYILFADVLEHLNNPSKVLEISATLLKPDGKILASIPNIAHNSVIIDLIKNKFDYTENGILDKTHQRFFTYDSIINLFEDNDLKPVCFQAVYENVGSTIINNTYDDIDFQISQLLKSRPMADVYQFVVMAVKKAFYDRNNEIINIEKNFETGFGYEPLSIYYDKGTGFNEDQKFTFIRRVNPNGEFMVSISPTEKIDSFNKLRLDICEYPCVCRLSYFKINDEILIQEQSNAYTSCNEDDFFFTNDPFYLFSGQTVTSIEKIEVAGNIIPLEAAKKINSLIDQINNISQHQLEINKKIIEQITNEKILIEKSKDNLLDKLNTELTINNSLKNDVKKLNEKFNALSDANAKYQDANEKYQKDIEELITVNQRILYLENDLVALKESTCWKITKPLRILGGIKKKVCSGNAWRRKLHKVYLAIPLPFSIKKGIKGAIFTILTPLIKNTETYRIWKNSKLESASGYQYSIEPKLQNHLEGNLSDQYMEQIMKIPLEGPLSGDYVSDKNHCYTDIKEEDIKYLAFYLPQYHPFEENNEWWGKGFTEWTNVSKAVPQFVNHYQPRLAGELGYYDLRMISVIQEQISLAKKYGIYGFCIYYYWFDGKTLMETPLKLIKENPQLDIPFCLCWANENWSRRWDGKENDILISQNYDKSFASKFIESVLEYMTDERYIKINGKPLLIIYNANQIPDIRNVIKTWRKIGLNKVGELHLLAVVFALSEDTKMAGFDGFIEFPPHSIYQYSMPTINSNVQFINSGCQSIVYDYQQIVREKKYLKKNLDKYYKGIFMAWDNSARKPNAATIYHNYSVAAFKEWLKDLSVLTKDRRASGDRFVFINAWNEWAEGTYLEPDRHYGYANLNAVYETFIELRQNSKKIIVVNHDACFAGAQMLALNIIAELRSTYHYEVYTILKNSGPLIDEFKKLSVDVCISSSVSDSEFTEWVTKTHATLAICNTVVSGDVLHTLTNYGISCIALIHEMEKVIHQYSCEKNLHYINEEAVKIIFASSYVKKSADRIEQIDKKKTVIAPQGMYQVNQYLKQRDAIRKEIRVKHGLEENTLIVLGVGYGYYRKGTDIFLDIASKMCSTNSNIVFMWVGDLDAVTQTLANKVLKSNGLQKQIIMAGKQTDAMKYFAASDIFVLTSREDPFPSVVMEAFYAYLPVIAFCDGGGYVDIISEQNGSLVPMEDSEKMIDVLEELINNPQKLKQKGKNAHEFIAQKFSFTNYIGTLLNLLGEKYEKVSVIIPNYNYADYLPKRIESVLNQTYPVHEILILDDASTDNSREVIEKYQKMYPLKIRSIFNDINSHNVFKQWKKGIDSSNCDFVWIAEADDLAKPTFLENLIGKFKSDNVVMAYCESIMIDEYGKRIGDNYLSWVNDVDDKLWKSDFVMNGIDFIEKTLSVKNVIPNVSAVLFRKQDFSDAFKMAEEYKVAGDWMFYVQLLKKGGYISFTSSPLNYHRRHSNSVTTDLKAKQHFDEICSVQDYIAQEYGDGILSSKILAFRSEVKNYLKVTDC